jgi:hypothetical protein
MPPAQLCRVARPLGCIEGISPQAIIADAA